MNDRWQTYCDALNLRLRHPSEASWRAWFSAFSEWIVEFDPTGAPTEIDNAREVMELNVATLEAQEIRYVA